jgi:hypothetical protein
MAEEYDNSNQTLDGHLTETITGNELPAITTDTRDNITFVWPSHSLVVDAERFNADGQVELSFWRDTTDYKKLLLQTRVNLLSISNKSTLIRRLVESVVEADLEFIPWDWVLTCITYKVLKVARQGEPLETIWPNEEDNLKPVYLLEPLLYLRHPSVLFGDYGSLKSLVALVVAYVIQLPYQDNKLGLITPKESTHCLILDYEDDPSSFRKRWGAIQRGFGIEASMPIEYRRMTSTVTDSVESLQKIIADEKIGLLIIDSLGPAARGNLNDPEPAIKYHEALRKLGITSLTLAHNSKDLLTKKRTIFGSVFFTNLARSIWECKAEQEPGEDEAIISLKHCKANLSKLHPPLGYKFTFTDNSIAIARTDLRDTGLSGELPIKWQIRNLLKNGALAARQISEMLGKPENTVRPTLTRMSKDGQVVNLPDHTWGLEHGD